MLGGRQPPPRPRQTAVIFFFFFRSLPLTSTTLASQIGVQPDELDDALHGRPAVRLAAWATAG